MMKVADQRAATWIFIDLAETFGGHEVMLLRWMQELRATSNIQSVLVCIRNSRLAANAQSVCRVEEIPAARHGGGKLSTLFSICRLAWHIYRLKRRHLPEIAIVAEGGLMAQRHGLYVARLLRLCTVVYVPLVDSFSAMQIEGAAGLDHRIRTFYGKLPSAWLTITSEQAVEFCHWSHVRQPIFLLPNTVSQKMEAAAGRLMQRSGPSSSERLRVLVLGRLDRHQKGLDLLIEYLQRSPLLSSEVTLSLVGEGPYREDIESALNADIQLKKLLRLLPWADTMQAFTDHDVLLITSRYEGVPLVMLEAMCAGIPVVTSDLPGTRMYIEDACRYPPGQLDVAFKRLLQLHQSEQLRSEIAGRNLATFRMLASGQAFTEAVSTLSSQLRNLAQH